MALPCAWVSWPRLHANQSYSSAFHIATISLWQSSNFLATQTASTLYMWLIHSRTPWIRDAVSTRKRQIKPQATELESPPVEYNKLTTSKHQEILDKVADFYTSLSDFATSSGLNPVDVTCYALGGELKGAKMNCWKCFQLLSGMARNGRKLLFHL